LLAIHQIEGHGPPVVCGPQVENHYLTAYPSCVICNFRSVGFTRKRSQYTYPHTSNIHTCIQRYIMVGNKYLLFQNQEGDLLFDI